MKHLLIVLVILLACAPGILKAQEQDGEGETFVFSDTGVWVTTQDFSSLRAGPSTAFARLAIIDPEVTLPAVGRTSNVGWVQVVYQGQPGWIFSNLLVWSGDIITLPVDGIVITPFVRRATAVGITTRETPIYRDGIAPEQVVTSLPPRTHVELTGRMGGDTRFFQFQILHQGELYWVGSWNIRVVEGNYRRLLDRAYIYPYGRLVVQLEANIAAALGSYQQINRIWQSLSQGEAVSCGLRVSLAVRDIREGDFRREAFFPPAVTALDNAIAAINSAIAAFEDACRRNDPFLERAEVNATLASLAEAERNLILAGSLLQPLRNRNPLLRILNE